MEPVEAELFTSGGNGAIVRLPGRRFPGVLVQGDSLSVLLSMAETVETLLAAGRTPEAAEGLGDLADSLGSMLRDYEAVLREHGMTPPYAM
jgi:hypothetical protein